MLNLCSIRWAEESSIPKPATSCPVLSHRAGDAEQPSVLAHTTQRLGTLVLLSRESSKFSSVLLAWNLNAAAFKGLSWIEAVRGNQGKQNQRFYTAVYN